MCYPPGANNGGLTIPDDLHRNEVAGKWLLFVGKRFLFLPINSVVERRAAIIGRHCGVRMNAWDQHRNADDVAGESFGFHVFSFPYL
jgi:hypothetical protein